MDDEATPRAPSRGNPAHERRERAEAGAGHSGASRMLARAWAVAACREPAAYGIPALPAWRVEQGEDGGLTLAACGDQQADDGSRGAFISADRPLRVRR